ncbi:cyclic di-GMP phosphodiesterase Gmr [mine drainage metagenome]|uniref:Cyclic di-GMP phosphodiesterase Gmr n=1 Tax=mine drainage metagenome TaxID=410659 RepID=A0A1J5SMD3_9ZZZZ
MGKHMKERPVSYSRFFSLTLLSGIAGLASVVAILVTSLANEYREADKNVRTEVENISRLLEDHTLGDIEKVDLMLRDLQGHIRPGDMRLTRNSGSLRATDLHALLKSHLETVPEVSVLNLTNAKGEHIHSSVSPLPHIDISDRSHFIRQRDNPNEGLVISPPLVSRTTGKWTLALTRRLNFEDGSFAGVAVAMMDMEHFQNLFHSLDLGPHGSVALYDKEFHLAARFPPSEKDVGKTIHRLTVQNYLDKGLKQGIYHAKSSVDGIDRIYSFRQVRDLPLLVSVGIAEEDYLATWYRHIWQYSLGAIIFSLVVIVFWLRQRRVEEALRQDEERFRHMLETSPIAVRIASSAGRKVLFSNRRYAELIESPPDQIAGVEPRLYYSHPQDFDDVLQSLSRNESITNKQVELLIPGGKLKWTLASYSNVKYGNDSAILGWFYDITERKAAEDAMHKSNIELSLFRKLLDNSNDAIEVLEPGTMRFLDMNETECRELGYSREELLSMCVYDVDIGFTLDTAQLIEQQVRQTGSVRFDSIHRRKDGSTFPVEISVKLIEVDKPYLLSIARDITERKRLELEKEQYFKFFNLSINPMCIADPYGCFKQVNPAFVKLTGYSENELIAKPFLDFVLQEDRQKTADEMKLQVGVRPTMQFDNRYRCKDGKVIHLSWMAYYDRNDDITYATAIDITERRKVEAELRIAATAFESQEGMQISDAQNTILRVNNAFTEITGYNAADAIGKNPRFLDSGKHDAAFFAAVRECIDSTGTWDGEIKYKRKNGEIFPAYINITSVKDNNGTIANYVTTFTDISIKSEAAEKIKNLAFYDPLTNLPNRRLLIDRLHQAFASSARSSLEGAVLFIDLDNFKDINDTLGHDIGDLLLQQTAQRLKSCIREGDTVARLGGDEFVVMLEELSEQPIEAATQTKAVGDKILAVLNQPYQLATHEYRSTSSIGATLFSDHHQSSEELLKRADIAMYHAKKSGRNVMRFFNQKMQDVINARTALESELRKALENGQFRLYYQIQVDSSDHPFGAEALIRWVHPERGLISPDQFIQHAEETGLILPIGQWVLETACIQLKAWEQDALTRDLVLSVNVSARQFHQMDFVAQVRATVSRHAIIPARLKLELTESMLLEKVEEIIANMNALKTMGIRFSLDDFGTGYSSLQYLKQLPLNQLKIDQSFVRDIATNDSDKAIVRTIIAMANSFKLDVIAEGVETEEQQQVLMGKGCTHYQGYLFGKPLPLEQFEALLKLGTLK